MGQIQVVKHLLGYLKRVWAPFALSLALLFVVAGLTAAKAWIIQPVVDTFLAGSVARADLIRLCLLVAGIFVFQAAFTWFYAVISRKASAEVMRSIRSDLFTRLSEQPLGYFSGRPSADLASRVVNDVATFENVAVSSVQFLLRDAVTIGLLVLVLLLKEWRLALSCLVILAVVGLLLRQMGGRISLLGRQVQEMVGKLHHQLSELIHGIDLILGFGLAERWKATFEEVNLGHYETQIRSTKASSGAVLSVNLVVGLGLTVILLVTGNALIQGKITAGDFGTFLGAIYLMQTPASTLGYSFANLSRGMAAAGRAFELLEEHPAIVDPADPVALPGGELPLEMDRLTFAYREGRPVLRNLSFRVAPGELVVMVGDSGAGKSTVAKLLLRFYDSQEGTVRVGGVPIRSLARSELYRAVSYVPQDIFLFDGSLEFNLRVGGPGASTSALDEAVRLACLDQLVAELPEGLETPVGERGKLLSGGQRQRVAIARALLAAPRALVLDEATSALDMELERRIVRNLVEASGERTLFAVTHRLSLAEIADRVLVLKEGRLVEEGSAAELAARGGEFARLKRMAREGSSRPGGRRTA